MVESIVAHALSLANPILLAANVIIGFSLFAYVFAHNVRSPVARAFCALIVLVTVVYLVDLGMDRVSSAEAAQLWLRIQWIGIAMVPAAYLHFSETVLRTTGVASRWRTAGIVGSYLLGAAALGLALFTDLIVYGIGQMADIYHLLPGPLFWAFALYYGLVSAFGWSNILRAQARCLTTTTRRRMGYLKWAFAAPGIGVFPYLLVATTAQILSPNVIYLLSLAGNMATAVMVVVIGYIVAYQGVLSPDRVIKHNLLHFLLRGPVAAILVVGVMLTVLKAERILGLPQDAVLVVAVAGSIVLLQLGIGVAKPAIDRVINRRDRDELVWIQSLDERLLTTTDLEQFLENTLIAICELLRVPSGFVITMEEAKLSLRVFCGERVEATSFLSRATLATLLERLDGSRRDSFLSPEDLVPADGYWLLPLRARSEKRTLGILGIRSHPEGTAALSDADMDTLFVLVRRAETALEDMQLQQRIFGLIASLESEVDQIQQWRSIARYTGTPAMEHLEMNPMRSPGFDQVVKDALSHYWGGPKLSQSPLLGMRIVAQRLVDMDNVPAKAVRAVLKQAIDMLRPPGERSLASNEWVVYNILDLRFVQGQRIRDIAQRLAISESDYYRKQRVAIEQVADALTQMERVLEASQGGADGHRPAPVGD